MFVTRRSTLLAATAALSSGETEVPGAPGVPCGLVEMLVRRSQDANAALMRGDLETYRALMPFTPDFTLMSPFGGEPTHARQLSEERMQALGRFFRNGDFAQELVHAYASPDMVVLVVVERTDAEVGGLPAQDWALRVTLVFQRLGSDWRLAHRHADPLVVGVGHAEAAALARRR